MKNLKDILAESILSDDESLDTREVNPLCYYCNDKNKKVLSSEFNISFDELYNVLIDIRDNKLGITNKIYNKQVKAHINNLEWVIIPVAVKQGKCIDIMVNNKTNKSSSSIIWIYIHKGKPYLYGKNPIVDKSTTSNEKLLATYIKKYCETAFDIMYNSTDKKYDNFKQLFK